MRRALSLVLLLLAVAAASADTCPNGRTPNLCMKPTAQQLLNDNFNRIDETLGGMMSGPFDPADNGKVFDRGGAVINVKNAIFGAKGDGVTDDTTAIANAYSLTEATSGGVLYFPPGTYLMSSTLVLAGQRTFMGAGTNATEIKYTGTGYAFQLGSGSDTRWIQFKDMTVTYNQSADGAFDIRDQARFHRFDRMRVESNHSTRDGTAFLLSGESSCACFNEWNQVQVRNASVGWQFSGFANANLVIDSHCGVTTTCFAFEAVGSDTGGGDDNTILRTELNGTVTTGIVLDAGADRNTFFHVVADGPTTSIDIQSTTALYNVFIGGRLPNVTAVANSFKNHIHVGNQFSSTNAQTQAVMAQGIRAIPLGSATPGTCNSNTEGMIYYDDDVNELCVCVNGTGWLQIDDMSTACS